MSQPVPSGMYLHLISCASHISNLRSRNSIFSLVMCGRQRYLTIPSQDNLGFIVSSVGICSVSASGHAEFATYPSGWEACESSSDTDRAGPGRATGNCPLKRDKCLGPVENCIIAMLGIIAVDESSHGLLALKSKEMSVKLVGD